MYALKRFSIISVLVVFMFSSLLVYPRQKVQAIAPAVAAAAAGVEIGVGAYVVGTLAVGSLGVALGLEYGDDIKAHAVDVWKSANQTIKDSMKASIAAAVQAGTGVVKLSQDVVDFLKSHFSTAYAQYVSASASVPAASLLATSNIVELKAPSGYVWVTYSLYHGHYVFSSEVRLNKSSNYSGKYVFEATGVNSALTGVSVSSRVLQYFPQSLWNVSTSLLTSVDAARRLIQSWTGLVPVLMTVSEAQSFKDAHLTNKDLWDSQIDAVASGAMSTGVYVPFDDIAAYPVDTFGTRVSDQPLVWNDSTKVWERAEGGTWTGSIDWDFPIPKVTEGGKVTVGDTVAIGEGVGTKVGEGAEVGTGEGILSDILTGVQTIADTLTTGLVGDVSRINWDKLKLAGSAFTTAFPFSIPWDVGRAFDAVFGSFDELEDMPKWTWDINFLGEIHKIEFEINDYFLEWFEIIRSVMLILFDVGLVYAVRKWLGGAS
jgi:hypothetical protein